MQLPYIVKFTEKEIKDLIAWGRIKYPKEAPTMYKKPDRVFGFMGEDAVEGFFEEERFSYTHHSRALGTDNKGGKS